MNVGLPAAMIGTCSSPCGDAGGGSLIHDTRDLVGRASAALVSPPLDAVPSGSTHSRRPIPQPISSTVLPASVKTLPLQPRESRRLRPKALPHRQGKKAGHWRPEEWQPHGQSCWPAGGSSARSFRRPGGHNIRKPPLTRILEGFDVAGKKRGYVLKPTFTLLRGFRSR